MAPIARDSSKSDVFSSDGEGMRISGSALLPQIADALVASPYPLLAAACAHDQSTRGAALTLADCLAPATACTRMGEGISCAINGSATCAAQDPGSAYHSILGDGPCWRANRSATAAALVALDAELEIAGAGGDVLMSAAEFLALTDPNAIASNASEVAVLGARLTAAAAGGFQRLFVTNREDDATLCLAALQRTDGDVRLVLGGVSPRPYRVYTSVEEEAMAGGLDEETIAGLADRALLDADTDSRSAGTVDCAAALLRAAITEIASS